MAPPPMQRPAYLLLAVTLASLTACTATPSEATESASQNETVWTADNCLDGQDLDAADLDISHCPSLPEAPQSVALGAEQVSLGAWELGTTANGDRYKYGSLASGEAGQRILTFEGGSVAVNEGNVSCWSKGYYRLRKILQDPPREWLALRNARFQHRFFQFQTDLRNGPTGFRKITSYQDHLVKWVTVIDAAGVCQQPTLGEFRDYAKSELTRRGIAISNDADAGSSP
jgi:hypothetical protein